MVGLHRACGGHSGAGVHRRRVHRATAFGRAFERHDSGRPDARRHTGAVIGSRQRPRGRRTLRKRRVSAAEADRTRTHRSRHVPLPRHHGARRAGIPAVRPRLHVGTVLGHAAQRAAPHLCVQALAQRRAERRPRSGSNERQTVRGSGGAGRPMRRPTPRCARSSRKWRGNGSLRRRLDRRRPKARTTSGSSGWIRVRRFEIRLAVRRGTNRFHR